MEEQIREHEAAIIELKRTRNSLLNVSKFPPEILGEIFRHNTALKASSAVTHSPPIERSYNFLLVCHHWFEVASHTPGLWGFWGHEPREWAKRYLQHPMAPLNLVLNNRQSNSTNVALDDSLRNALQARASQDTIRQIYLIASDSGILNSIISSLTGHEGIRSSSVESVDLQFKNPREQPVVSEFLAYYHFPKLRRLQLYNCIIPSWDLKTSVLTTLILDGQFLPPPMTSSQILSILHSNPLLQKISLDKCAVPHDGGDRCPRIQLAHLRELSLAGRLQDVFTLLRQLDCPAKMDLLQLNLIDGRVEDIPRTIGPYLRDHLRRRGRSQSGLGVLLVCKDPIEFTIGDTIDFSAADLKSFRLFADIYIGVGQVPSGEDLLDLIACIPEGEITCLQAYGVPISVEVISTRLPSLRGMHSLETPLHVAFGESNLGQDEISRSLQYIYVSLYPADGFPRGDWSLLANFLDRLASSGNRLDTLEIGGAYDMDPEVVKRIRRAVRVFLVVG